MKDLSVPKLKKLVDMLRERNVTSFKYKDMELKISYPMESIPQIELEDDIEDLTPEEQKIRDEAIASWST